MAIISNPLFDLEFLKDLLEDQQRTLYARITALTLDEKPIEYIEGQVTGGSINIDGKSAVRRTCSVSLVAKNLNITDFYWGLKTKFKLEIGLDNNINKNYPDIIWFKQGIYVINSFNTSKSTSGYTVNINGKDKMCLLNGDLSGALAHTTDFGIEEYYDSKTGATTYTSIPIKNIIREAVQNFGNELPNNIIINDIDDAGVELLEYRGDITLYLLKNIKTDVITNMTINANQPCFIDGQKTTIDSLFQYDNLIDLDNSIEEPTIITLIPNGEIKYTVIKVEYGSVPGYRLTDLTYAGDLILNVGETITALLDKIVNMLGNFEYFYNLDGKFVFQAKKIYTSIPWLNSENGDEVPTAEDLPMWSFLNNQLITSFQNTPNFANLRNDFAVWGTRKTASGSELDIHMRYAIDNKPEKYTSLIDGKTYIASEDKVIIENNKVYCDWRELIYRMALDYRKYYHNDDFLSEVAKMNTQYPTGRTGYEQYYTDLEGFWRTLYDPNPEPYYVELDDKTNLDNVWVRYAIRPLTENDVNSGEVDLSLLFFKDTYIDKEGQEQTELKPFYGGYCFLDENREYGYLTTTAEIEKTSNRLILSAQNIQDIYISLEDLYVTKKNEGYAQMAASSLPDKIYPNRYIMDKKIHSDVINQRETILVDYKQECSIEDNFIQAYKTDDGIYWDQKNTEGDIERVSITKGQLGTFTFDEKTITPIIYIKNENGQTIFYKVISERIFNNEEDSNDSIEIEEIVDFITEDMSIEEKNLVIDKITYNSEESYNLTMWTVTYNKENNEKRYIKIANLQSGYMTEDSFNNINEDIIIYQKFGVPIIRYGLGATGYKNYKRLDEYLYGKILEDWREEKIDLFIEETNSEVYVSLNGIDNFGKDKNNQLEDKWLQKQYVIDGVLTDKFEVQQYDNYGIKKDDVIISYPVSYYNQLYNYSLETHWHNNVLDNPETLLFWFDFLDADQSDLNKYSVPVVGTRSKALTDKDVKSIYYKDIPKVIFQSGKEIYEHETGYTYIQLQDTMENLFTISSRGKSAKEKVEELLQDYGYCTESISLTALPVYHLEPNHRIVVQDNDTQINGEYLVDKITLPLTYNGTMNITATKVVSDLK